MPDPTISTLTSPAILNFTPVDHPQLCQIDISVPLDKTPTRSWKRAPDQLCTPPTTAKRSRIAGTFPRKTTSLRDNDGSPISSHLVIAKPNLKAHANHLHKSYQTPTFDKKRAADDEAKIDHQAKISVSTLARLAVHRYNAAPQTDVQPVEIFNEYLRPGVPNDTSASDAGSSPHDYLAQVALSSPNSWRYQQPTQPVPTPVSPARNILTSPDDTFTPTNALRDRNTFASQTCHFENPDEDLDHRVSPLELADLSNCRGLLDYDSDHSRFADNTLEEETGAGVGDAFGRRTQMLNPRPINAGPIGVLTYSNHTSSGLGCSPNFLQKFHPLPVNHISSEHKELDEFGEDIDIAEMIQLTDKVSKVDVPPFCQTTSRPSTPKLLWNSPRNYDPSPKFMLSPVKISPSPSQCLNLSDQFVDSDPPQSQSRPMSPLKFPIASISTIPDVSSNHVPFVRPQFPSVIRDRSPIPGLSPRLPLITHFRLGAALNHAAKISRSFLNSDTLIELYSRVVESTRDGPRQTMKFADLFHSEKPPFLDAVWIGWRGMPYWEQDALTFLDDQGTGRLCRVVGKIERERSKNWKMCVLSMWEASWDDIEAIRGIICA